MRVQDLLLAVLFLEGITEALAVVLRPLRSFTGIAKSAPERPEIKNISDLRFVDLCTR